MLLTQHPSTQQLHRAPGSTSESIMPASICITATERQACIQTVHEPAGGMSCCKRQQQKRPCNTCSLFNRCQMQRQVGYLQAAQLSTATPPAHPSCSSAMATASTPAYRSSGGICQATSSTVAVAKVTHNKPQISLATPHVLEKYTHSGSMQAAHRATCPLQPRGYRSGTCMQILSWLYKAAVHSPSDKQRNRTEQTTLHGNSCCWIRCSNCWHGLQTALHQNWYRPQ